MDELSIRQVVEKVSAGSIRIPAFQRGFVWDADRVAYLMDSIYKRYPFGAVILWRTKEQLKSEKQLGPFVLPERDPDYPIDYVLDGQQRLTSVFGVFQSDLTPAVGEDTAWTRIFYDFDAEADLQESQFVSLDEDAVDPDRHFPVGSFFDVTGYRQATKDLRDARLKEIDTVQSYFKEARIPVQLIETDERAKVAIVFERVNRLGMELDIFQLLAAWTWSEEFDLRDRFADLAADLEPFGFGDLSEDTNLLLRCCSAIVGGDASAPGLLALNGAEVRDRFAEITNGIKGAIDFVRSNLLVQRLRNLPYPTLLVPLAVFFAAPEGKDVQMNDAQRSQLVRWFWRAAFSRRFSAGVLKKLNRDVGEAAKLRDDGASDLDDLSVIITSDWFLDNRFTIGSVNTGTFILLLAHAQPLSFVSGAKVDLAKVLNAYNRHEFHHIFPKKYLKDQGRIGNRLANFAVISAVDNRELGGEAPSSYKERMPANPENVLASALLPESMFEDEYDAFLDKRAERLVSYANELCGL